MGRPKKAAAERVTKRLSASVTPGEFDLLVRLLDLDGMAFPTWLRHIIHKEAASAGIVLESERLPSLRHKGK